MLTFRSIKQVQLLTTTTTTTSGTSNTTNENAQSSSKKTIGITILFKDGTVHDFCNMDNPNQVWAGLIALQNENLTSIPQPSLLCDTTAPMTPTAATKQQQALRRTNSDPLMSSQFKRTESTLSEICNQNNDNDDDAADSSISRKVATVNKDEPLSPQKADVTTTTTTSAGSSSNLAQEWNETVAKMVDYSNLVVDKQVLYNCTLQKFVDFFVKDQADYSIAKYLHGRGDSELQETEWKSTSTSDNNCNNNNYNNAANQSRTVHYMHPVNVPMAPPKAGARKEQTYCRYGDYGLVIETRTYVRDVPMTDCFYVVDRILVEPNYRNPSDSSSNKENQQDLTNINSNDSSSTAPPPSVLVSMKFQINFVKSTMFKGIISKTTSSEFKAFFQDSK